MKMTKTPAVKRSFLRDVIKQAEEHAGQQLKFAKYDSILGTPDWQVMQRITDLEPRSLAKQYSSKLGSMSLPGAIPGWQTIHHSLQTLIPQSTSLTMTKFGFSMRL